MSLKGAMKFLLSLALLALTACAGNKLTVQDETALGVLTAEVALCNAQPDPQPCLAAAKAAFDAAQSARFADAGGFVAPDAGGAL